ncbi:unnamed protein product [Orchesella dallaii]|uniref:Odorant receptor n=1 Tax=Orchesella dallaii TaxID=48710 RepID=A0ABP1QCL1_9HEXA
MGFGEAYYNCQLLHQKIFETPYHLDSDTKNIIPNKYLKARWKMKAWSYGAILCILFGTNSAWSLIRSILKIQAGEPVFMEEVIVHGFAVPMVLQTLATMYTMERNPHEDAYMINQIFKAGNTQHKGWPSMKRRPDLPELLSYGIAIAFCSFPLAIGVYPLVRSRDPINVALVDVLPEIPRRLLASLVYSTVIFYCANICASFLQIRLAFTHIFGKITKANLTRCLGTCSTPRIFQRRNFRSTSGTQKDWNFNQSRKCLNQYRLLMAMANRSNHIYIPLMTYVGMVFCIFALYACVTMYDVQKFRIMMPFVCFIAFGMPTFIAFFIKHGSLPLIHSDLTITFWRKKMLKPAERKELKAMVRVGFEMGQFFIITNMMALQIMDVILNHTISLLLA